MQVMTDKSLSQRRAPAAICFTLHFLLVLAHIVLLISGSKHWEHRFTFLLEHQTLASFWTTAITQAFGTIYTSLLVFLTQKLAMQRTFRSCQTLTATHDSLSSWTGLGSALSTLYNQVSIPASVIGTLHVVGYLGCISILHTTIPAILSAETFNATVAINVTTVGNPEFANSTAINSTVSFVTAYPTGFLPWWGLFDDTPTPGLFNNSLYEVLHNTTSGNGEARVSALGFNITCGYLNANINRVDLDESIVYFTVNNTQILLDPDSPALIPNSLSILNIYYPRYSSPNNSVVISTPNVVADSEGHQGSPSILSNLTKLTLNISQIQCLQCFKSLVPQYGTIDTRSNALFNVSLWPNIHKNHSKWMAAVDIGLSPQDSTLLGSDLTRFNSGPRYLMSSLGLNPLVDVSSTEPVVLKLHDLENALANLVAISFWTGGHIQPDPWYLNYSTSRSFGTEPATLPVLSSGSTIIHQDIASVRLNASMISVALGLVTSIALAIL
ncbi:hypothetical protein DFH08DRAFT_940257, partial [Mycena albidolilacea]